MTERPYNDEDLRAEAARQHAVLTEDPDYVGVGEQMDDEMWRSLNEDDYDAAQRSIHGLIEGAADTSEWAVELGADGLEPTDVQLTLDGDHKPIARIHFAFEPGMPEEMRMTLIQGVGQAIARHL